jgi:hypothetical protein
MDYPLFTDDDDRLLWLMEIRSTNTKPSHEYRFIKTEDGAVAKLPPEIVIKKTNGEIPSDCIRVKVSNELHDILQKRMNK